MYELWFTKTTITGVHWIIFRNIPCEAAEETKSKRMHKLDASSLENLEPMRLQKVLGI